MEQEIATAVVIGIAVLESLVWMFALKMMLRATRERHTLSDLDPLATESENPSTTITGSADVPGGPDELSAKLAARRRRRP
jgi:hypothetical protein